MLKYILRFILFVLISNLCNLYTIFANQPIYAQSQKSKIQLRRPYTPPQSALVIEYSETGCKTLYQQNADAIRHPASLTKIMTVYLLLEALQSNRVKPNTLFRVSKLASAQMPSKLNLKPGSYIRAIDCVKALLVKSANDVAVVVAEGLMGSVSEFCKQMNIKAKSLGMLSTHFENPSGVPNIKQVTSARDMFKLGLDLYKRFPKYWKYFALKDFAYLNQHYTTHCKILNWYKGVDGVKTGFINASGFNLWVTAQRYKTDGTPRRLFVVVFGGPSGKLRDFRAASLMNRFFQDCAISKLPVKTTQCTKKSITKPIICDSKIDTKDKKVPQNNKASNNTEEILVELDSVPIEDILKSSGKNMQYFDELYKDDEAKILQITTSKVIDYGIYTPKQYKNEKPANSKNEKTLKQKTKPNKNIKPKADTQKPITHKMKTSHLNKPIKRKKLLKSNKKKLSLGQLLENCNNL